MPHKSEQPNNTVKINYIIYENNDTALLLYCTIRKKNKSYISNIPIEFVRFTQLLQKVIFSHNVTETICDKLFNSGFPINQVNPSTILEKDLIFNTEEILSFEDHIKLSA